MRTYPRAGSPCGRDWPPHGPHLAQRPGRAVAAQRGTAGRLRRGRNTRARSPKRPRPGVRKTRPCATGYLPTTNSTGTSSSCATSRRGQESFPKPISGPSPRRRGGAATQDARGHRVGRSPHVQRRLLRRAERGPRSAPDAHPAAAPTPVRPPRPEPQEPPPGRRRPPAACSRRPTPPPRRSPRHRSPLAAGR